MVVAKDRTAVISGGGEFFFTKRHFGSQILKINKTASYL